MVRTALILLSIVFAETASVVGHWPIIRNARESIFIADANNPIQAALEFTIYGIKNDPLYNIKCHSGDYDSDDINYSGLIQCYLFSLYSDNKSINLLRDLRCSGRNWQNRGRFLTIHLVAGCSNYPEWGATRKFKLRNMELTISITDIDFVPNQKDLKAPLAKSYKLNVSAEAVSNAPSESAEPAEYPEPPWFYSTSCEPL